MGKKKRSVAPARRRAQTRGETGIDLTRPVDLVVLSIRGKAARCRPVGSDRVVTLHAGNVSNLVPGEIATVLPNKRQRPDGPGHLCGRIESTRLDIGALGLVPLRLEERGVWDSAEALKSGAGEPVEEWAQPIIAAGPRPRYEMEQVLPGWDPGDLQLDPTCRATEHWQVGDAETAVCILMDLCEGDLRCIDAHAHLGNFAFEGYFKNAIRHYEVGLRIAELSLPDGFDGLLPWICLDNRPYLRCLHGHGLCMWRLQFFERAERVFERMLRLNPTDNQGARFLIAEVRRHAEWVDPKDGW